MVTQGQDTVDVVLRPFNDKRYNQDLEALCEQVNAAAPHLPDGRRLQVSIDHLYLVFVTERPLVFWLKPLYSEQSLMIGGTAA
ncbi:hypothetical protein KSC_096280 [Ktedonobacter sp. SOSP1-52]|nr:hypothetical protein KSC_096280 [Ktedonobacter sp. SOSP1-52]